MKRSKEYIKNYYKKYYIKNREKMRQHDKEYYAKNKNKISLKCKEWRTNNPDKFMKSILKCNKEFAKRYLKNNNESYINAYIKRRRKLDDDFCTRTRLSNLLRRAINNYSKNKHIGNTNKLINYNAIINHLKPFPKDISKYHIDHIRPLRTFDLTKKSEIKKAFAPENLQWLTAHENLTKSGKWNANFNNNIYK